MNKHSIRSSVYALLAGTLPSRVAAEKEERMENIRDAMLQSLREAERDYPHVSRRVRHAGDIQALWFLRGDAMSALAATLGEIEARHRMAKITSMFHGMLPKGLRPRETRIGHLNSH